MGVDWAELFKVDSYPVEMFVRGTVMYWFIFLLLRVAGRRDIGSLGVADLLVFMLIADAAGSAMGGNATSLPSGMVVVATMVFWTVLVDRISYFFPAARRWLEAEKVLLVRDGVMLRRGMRREYVTEDELMAELRLKGVEDLREVKRAYMESDGHISVIRSRSRRWAGESTPPGR